MRARTGAAQAHEDVRTSIRPRLFMTAASVAVADGRTWTERHVTRLRLSDVPAVAGATAAAIGIVVLIGWAVGIRFFGSDEAGLPTMKANTAITFIAMGIGVVLLSGDRIGPRSRRLGLACVAAATTIALVTGIQWLIGRDLGVDEVLFSDRLGAVGTAASGRMSPMTSIAFVLLGVAVALRNRAPDGVAALCGLAMAVSMLNILTVALGAAPPAFLAGSAQMAVGTASVMGLLAVGVPGLLGRSNPFAVLAGSSPTATLFRLLLAAMLAFPLVLLVLTRIAESLHIFDSEYGVALRTLGILVVAVIAVVQSARWAAQLEAKRLAAEIERDNFFELSLDMLSVIGSDGRFRRVNNAWEAVLGYPAMELIGRSFTEFLHPDDLAATTAEAERQYGEGQASFGFQNRYRHHDGGYRWLEWMSHTSPDHSVAYGVAREITVRNRDEERRARNKRVLERRNEALSERVVRDPLTDLRNRRHFDAAIGRMERRWRRTPLDRRPPVSVIMFDLDHFGMVNKLHGHQAGDEVLRQFASLLKRRFREQDLVARYGGEEFVAVLEGASISKAIAIAEAIRASFEQARIAVGEAAPLSVTVSAGCAQVGDDGRALEALSVADVWLSQAKRAGRNQVIGLQPG